MRVPLKLSHQGPGRKLIAAAVIALLCTFAATGVHNTPIISIPLAKLDDLLYDSMYKLRSAEDRTHGPVVIVDIDDQSIHDLLYPTGPKRRLGWPWPREIWGQMVAYLDRCGAREVVFDLLFNEPTPFNDDSRFARLVDMAKVRVIFATEVSPDGKLSAFEPRVTNPVFGAVNLGDSIVFRRYQPLRYGIPSLALEAANGVRADRVPAADEPFLLHYYGPFQRRDGKNTFRYVRASKVYAAAMRQPGVEIDSNVFRNKIVLIGGTAVGVADLKSSPLSDPDPGVDIQATAIEDLLEGRRVHVIPGGWAFLAGFGASLIAAIGVVLPRHVALKLLAGALAAAALLGAAATLFRGNSIQWLPLATPILALLLATLAAFSWSYFAEDRQRRLVLKALSQYVSPEVAAEIERDPQVLKLGGEAREMTVMFTDIQGFTDLSEQLEVDKLGTLLNYYLGEMSALVLSNNGTLDKYIGDAIMSFWNAPVRQPDHAVLACRAALAMQRREQEIQPELQKLGATSLLTRIGVNSGPMIVGNMGSSQKFNYSVLGDAVNLGSRLESANKFYGSQILLSQNTADLVRGNFVMRQLDVLRVKGKKKPMAVYELMADGTSDTHLTFRVEAYEAAFRLYQQQRWDEAAERLAHLRNRSPSDLCAAALLERIANLRQHPPGVDWDGVYVAKGK